MLDSLLPDPLHPAVVHLPVALAVLLPPFAIGALIAIRRGARPLVAWGVVTALLVTLALTSWLAVETGEEASERAERVVTEQRIEPHEDAAEALLYGSVAVAAIAGVGLSRGRLGAGARLAGTLGTLALLVAGWRVGHSGGELVYRYGAASAYTGTSAGRPAGTDAAPRTNAAPHDDDDRR